MAGIVDSIQLVGVLILAIPATLAGLEFLFVRGEPLLGATFIGLGVGIVLVQRLFALPTGPSGLFTTLVGGPTEDDSDEAGGDADDEAS